MSFNWKYFNELTIFELYEIMKLRSEVFVVEQECVYQDFDDYDQKSLHLLCYSNDVLAAYLRLLPPKVKYEDSCSIGRVITKMEFRGTGLGYQIMRLATEKCKELYPEIKIKISAQYHLQNFYAKLGFQTNSAPYYEDNIAHIEMLHE